MANLQLPPPTHGGDQYSGLMKNKAFDETPNDTFANMTAAGTVIAQEWQPRTKPPVPPSEPGNRAEVFRYINEQLDCFGKSNELLGRYHLLGPNERRAGGVCFFVCFSSDALGIVLGTLLGISGLSNWYHLVRCMPCWI